MSHDLNYAAAILNTGPHRLRKQLRTLGVLTAQGELAPAHRGGKLFAVDTRQRWSEHFRRYIHYGVIQVTDDGIAWLAKQLGIRITTTAAAPASREARP